MPSIGLATEGLNVCTSLRLAGRFKTLTAVSWQMVEHPAEAALRLVSQSLGKGGRGGMGSRFAHKLLPWAIPPSSRVLAIAPFSVRLFAVPP